MCRECEARRKGEAVYIEDHLVLDEVHVLGDRVAVRLQDAKVQESELRCTSVQECADWGAGVA